MHHKNSRTNGKILAHICRIGFFWEYRWCVNSWIGIISRRKAIDQIDFYVHCHFSRLAWEPSILSYNSKCGDLCLIWQLPNNFDNSSDSIDSKIRRIFKGVINASICAVIVVSGTDSQDRRQKNTVLVHTGRIATFLENWSVVVHIDDCNTDFGCSGPNTVGRLNGKVNFGCGKLIDNDWHASGFQNQKSAFVYSFHFRFEVPLLIATTNGVAQGTYGVSVFSKTVFKSHHNSVQRSFFFHSSMIQIFRKCGSEIICICDSDSKTCRNPSFCIASTALYGN